MIVSQSDIDLVLNPKIRRRQMRLPASSSPKAQCPLRIGGVYNLQPRAFAKGQAQITVTALRKEPLEALSLHDARREGYAGVQGALDAFKRAHGLPAAGQLVWVVEFARGDESEFVTSDRPIYLSKFGDYSTDGSKQAVPGDPELCPPLPGAPEQARVLALAKRQQGPSAALRNEERELDSLRHHMVTMKARNRAKLIEKEMRKLKDELPIAELSPARAAVGAH